jgi:urease subunit alpha
MYGVLGRARGKTGVTFVSQVALDDDIGGKLRLQKQLVAVKGTRAIRKKDMIHNTLTPKIEVDPQNYQVRVDGEIITCEPADVLPMAQRYFLF